MESVRISSDGVFNAMREWSLEKGLKRDMIRRDYMEAKERLDLLQAEDECTFIAMKIRCGRAADGKYGQNLFKTGRHDQTVKRTGGRERFRL